MRKGTVVHRWPWGKGQKWGEKKRSGDAWMPVVERRRADVLYGAAKFLSTYIAWSDDASLGMTSPSLEALARPGKWSP